MNKPSTKCCDFSLDHKKISLPFLGGWSKISLLGGVFLKSCLSTLRWSHTGLLTVPRVKTKHRGAMYLTEDCVLDSFTTFLNVSFFDSLSVIFLCASILSAFCFCKAFWIFLSLKGAIKIHLHCLWLFYNWRHCDLSSQQKHIFSFRD